MKNAINQPLICIGQFANNNTKQTAHVKIVETRKPSGSWESIGYVNDKPICSCTSKDRDFNKQAVREDLADAGYYESKTLAPVMSAKLPKKGKSQAA